MDQKRVPTINQNLGYVRTAVGTVRVDDDGIVLFATGRQLEHYAEETGVIVDAEAVWVGAGQRV
jgi:hypothetical protein